MSLDIKNIPVVMRELNHWVLWKKEFLNGRWAKIPYNVSGRYMAKSNDSSTWTSFPNVLKCLDLKKYDGIGFMFTGSGITGIDIDHCLENGQISSHAQEIINKCSSYTEISPSGTGVHIYVLGTIPSGFKTEIEMYCEGRYFTVTGHKLNEREVEPRQAALDQLYRKYAKVVNETTERSAPTPRLYRTCHSDDDILQRAFSSRQGQKIRSLFEGDMSGYGNDHSDADLALCGYLAFWLDKDFERIDRAFRQSALYREGKWGTREKYRSDTINRAIAGCKQSRGTVSNTPPHCVQSFPRTQTICDRRIP